MEDGGRWGPPKGPPVRKFGLPPLWPRNPEKREKYKDALDANVDIWAKRLSLYSYKSVPWPNESMGSSATMYAENVNQTVRGRADEAYAHMIRQPNPSKYTSNFVTELLKLKVKQYVIDNGGSYESNGELKPDLEAFVERLVRIFRNFEESYMVGDGKDARTAQVPAWTQNSAEWVLETVPATRDTVMEGPGAGPKLQYNFQYTMLDKTTCSWSLFLAPSDQSAQVDTSRWNMGQNTPEDMKRGWATEFVTIGTCICLDGVIAFATGTANVPNQASVSVHILREVLGMRLAQGGKVTRFTFFEAGVHRSAQTPGSDTVVHGIRYAPANKVIGIYRAVSPQESNQVTENEFGNAVLNLPNLSPVEPDYTGVGTLPDDQAIKGFLFTNIHAFHARLFPYSFWVPQAEPHV